MPQLREISMNKEAIQMNDFFFNKKHLHKHLAKCK